MLAPVRHGWTVCRRDCRHKLYKQIVNWYEREVKAVKSVTSSSSSEQRFFQQTLHSRKTSKSWENVAQAILNWKDAMDEALSDLGTKRSIDRINWYKKSAQSFRKERSEPLAGGGQERCWEGLTSSDPSRGELIPFKHAWTKKMLTSQCKLVLTDEDRKLWRGW